MSKKVNKIPLFVHIPKTGGGTIANYLSVNNAPHLNNGHKRRLAVDVDLNAYYTFAVIRHPYSRYVSMVNYTLHVNIPAGYFVRDLFKYMNKPIDLNFIDFIMKNPDHSLITPMYLPQSEYFQFITYDKVYKFEDGYDSIIADITEKFDVNDVFSAEHRNPSQKVFTVDMLTEEQKSLIDIAYKDDFILYNSTV